MEQAGERNRRVARPHKKRASRDRRTETGGRRQAREDRRDQQGGGETERVETGGTSRAGGGDGTDRDRRDGWTCLAGRDFARLLSAVSEHKLHLFTAVVIAAD